MAHVGWVISYLVWIFTIRDNNGNLCIPAAKMDRKSEDNG